MSDLNPGTKANITKLILVPAIITLAITILRLVGELQEWSPRFFSAEPGGGGAVVGISWLPFLFGPYFALKLAGAGFGPASKLKAIIIPLLGIPVMALGLYIVSKGFALNIVVVTLGFLITFGAAFVALTGWRALGTTLLAYAFAARIPVLIVMFVGMRAGWKTHYSAIDPHFASAPFWQQFAYEALLPQMFFWISFTVVVGSFFGAIIAVIVSRRKQEAASVS